MLETHVRQPGFTYSACGPYTKNKERIQKFIKTGDSRYIYQNELDKTCFQHGKAYGLFCQKMNLVEMHIIKQTDLELRVNLMNRTIVIW